MLNGYVGYGSILGASVQPILHTHTHLILIILTNYTLENKVTFYVLIIAMCITRQSSMFCRHPISILGLPGYCVF